MKKNNSFFGWKQDLAEFASVDPATLPIGLSDSVTGTILNELRPSALKVFGKITFIQFFVGLVTLLFCPQFGLSLTSSMGLMPYLMKYGESVCMLGCGALFMGASLLSASFLLKPEEVRVLKSQALLQLPLLCTLSLGVLICVGAEIALVLGFVWGVGAVTAGISTLELGWSVRKLSAYRSLQ
jgi:hypothetical protein